MTKPKVPCEIYQQALRICYPLCQVCVLTSLASGRRLPSLPPLSYLPMNLIYLINELSKICLDSPEKMGVADIQASIIKI